MYHRITKVEHSDAAFEARELNAKRKTQDDIKVKRFKDVWPFDRLPYSDLSRHSSPPPCCHAISVVFKVHTCLVILKKRNLPVGFMRKKKVKKENL